MGRPAESSRAADEGTTAHKVFEAYVNNKFDPGWSWKDGLSGKEVKRLLREYDIKAMRAHAAQAWRYIRKLDISEGARFVTEVPLEMDDLVPLKDPLSNLGRLVDEQSDHWELGMSGTADLLVLDEPKRTLHVMDYKYGFRPVEAERNPQLMLYAHGACSEAEVSKPIKTCRMHILQPRLGRFVNWEAPMADVEEWARRVARPAAVEAYLPNPRRRAGDIQCRWCPAKANCTEHYLWLDGKLPLRRAVLGKAFPRLGPKLMAKAVRAEGALAGFIAACKEELEVRLRDGESVPGVYLGARTGKRSWDPAKRARLIRAIEREAGPGAAHVKTLIGLGKAAEIIGEAKVDRYTTESRPSPFLAMEGSGAPRWEDAKPSKRSRFSLGKEES